MVTASQSPTRVARGTVLAAAGLTLMAAAIIAPSLPAMAEEFAASPGADVLVRLALTVTSLAIAISAPLSGLVADRWGRRPLLVGALLLYAASGTAGLLVSDLNPLLVTRVLLGLAVGGIMTAVSAIITDWFDGPRRAAFLGRQQAAASLGGVVLLPVAGLLAAVSWRAPFWLYALAIVIVPFALLTLPRGTRGGAPVGSHAAVSGVAPRTGRRVAGIYLVALLATLAFFMAPTQLPFLLATAGAGPAVAGAAIAGGMLSSVAGAVAFPMVRRRLSPTAITVVSLASLGVGWVVVGAAGGVVFLIMVGLLIGGVGVGLAVPNLNLRLAELAAPHLRGRILSGLVAGIFLGQFLSPLVLQPLIHSAGIAGAFLWSGLALTATALVTIVTLGKHPSHR